MGIVENNLYRRRVPRVVLTNYTTNLYCTTKTMKRKPQSKYLERNQSRSKSKRCNKKLKESKEKSDKIGRELDKAIEDIKQSLNNEMSSAKATTDTSEDENIAILDDITFTAKEIISAIKEISKFSASAEDDILSVVLNTVPLSSVITSF